MTTKDNFANFALLTDPLSEANPENANDTFAHCPPGWTKERWDEEMNFDDHPFFMKPEQMENAMEDNEMLQALQALKYDEDPQETIKSFYKEANTMFKDHYVKDKSNRFYIKRILQKYTECIYLAPEDQELKAKILSNRALINIGLKNFGRVIEDCDEAIRCFPSFVKPYFRKCEAQLGLDRPQDAIDTAKLGLEQEKNKDLTVLLKTCAARLDFLEQKKKEREERLTLLQDRNFKLMTEKSIVLGKTMTFSMPVARSRAVNFDTDGNMSCPVAFLYPEFSQWDYVEKATEDTTLENIYGEIFQAGLPWDTNGYYRFPEDLEAYVQLNSVEPLIPIKDPKWKDMKGLMK